MWLEYFPVVSALSTLSRTKASYEHILLSIMFYLVVSYCSNVLIFDWLDLTSHLSSCFSSHGCECMVTCPRPVDRCQLCDQLRSCPMLSVTCSGSMASRSLERWTLKQLGQQGDFEAFRHLHLNMYSKRVTH